MVGPKKFVDVDEIVGLGELTGAFVHADSFVDREHRDVNHSIQ